MSKFISSTLGRACRLDASCTPEEYTGLYTDDVSHCNAIIIYKLNKEHKLLRASMMHIDQDNYFALVLQEFKWIGDGAKSIIVRRENSFLHAEIQYPFLCAGLTVKLLPKEHYAITFDRDATVTTYPRTALPAIETHPEECILDMHYKLNLVFSYVEDAPKDHTRLLFDGKTWQALSKHDRSLIPAAKAYWKHFQHFLGLHPPSSPTALISIFNSKYDEEIGAHKLSEGNTRFVWNFNVTRMLFGHDYKKLLMTEAKAFVPKEALHLISLCLENEALDKVKQLMLINMKHHPVIVNSKEQHIGFIENLFKKIMRMKQHQYHLSEPTAFAGAGKADLPLPTSSHVFKDIASDKVDLNKVLKHHQRPKETALPSPDIALRRAAFAGLIEHVRILSRQTDINTADRGKFKRTALHWAVIEKKTRVINYLLEQGANPTLEDNLHKTAIDYAKEAGNADLLLAYKRPEADLSALEV